MTVLILDNYDSFTHNLAQAFAALGESVEVWRNDRFALDEAVALDPSALVVSPGPGGPPTSRDPLGQGHVPAALEWFRGRVPVLGVCLGHQILADQLGARVRPTGLPVHGKPDRVFHDGVGIFEGLSQPFVAARYHSLAVERSSLQVPIHAWTEDGVVMGFGVPGEATWAVQFHPESFMTPEGPRLLDNFRRGVRALGRGRLPRQAAVSRETLPPRAATSEPHRK
ncbi:MAG: aminodeoxychorismate/anthranilate synthase component II [Planctomycetota bacterium]